MTLPNQLTVLRMALTPVFAMLLTYEEVSMKYASLLVYILASATDWYDGYIARKFGSITITGKYLDPLADKILVSTAFGMFAFLELIPVWMFVAMASRDALITGLRAYSISTRRSFETISLAKWKTALQMVVIYLMLLWIIAMQEHAGLATMPAFMQMVYDWNIVWNVMMFVTLYTLTTGIVYLTENRYLLKSLVIACYRVFVPTNVR